MSARRDLPPEPYVALFTIDVKPERRDEFLAAMDRAMVHSAQEPGILSFMILANRDDPNSFTACDVYADEAAFQLHNGTAATQRLIGELDGVLVGPPRGSFHHRLCEKKDFS